VNANELDALRAHIRGFARQYVVETEVWTEDMERSDVNPSGQRVHLLVTRHVEGQPPRAHPGTVAGFRPDVPNLRERLEAAVREAARALHAAAS
jgi:hypothetical protein